MKWINKLKPEEKMLSKIQNHHKEKKAYVYIRQSTMGQVRFNQESTERQYALKEKALQLGWTQNAIRILDQDLGKSGAQSSDRQDFKLLVADVSMNKVGAILSLEASRLSRSNTDWHRLLELCALTETLIIDEDGCYNPSDFNDQLLLGMKGTMSQAELHFIRARLLGGKLNKAKKGELRFPLPVGLCYDDENRIVPDPDEEVRNAITLLFSFFDETGSAYGVVKKFGNSGLSFPKRSYGGIWNGKLIWGHLSHNRVLQVLKNPSYAGVYTFGRYQAKKTITRNGDVQSRSVKMPMDEWKVKIMEHHKGYISWETFLKNQEILKKNQTNGEEILTSSAAREGKAILQGLLLCGKCGRKISVRYKGNGGNHAMYECNHMKREGLSGNACLSIRADIPDAGISNRILEIIKTDQIQIALKAFENLAERENLIDRQWKMKIEKAEYEAQLAGRRYEEVDPSNRLVAETLEKRWETTLNKVEEAKKQFDIHQQKHSIQISKEQRLKIVALAKNIPRLWSCSTTKEKDRKRILRLLIKDITVDKLSKEKKVVLHIRWQGGAIEDMSLKLPPRYYDKLRYSTEMINHVRELAKSSTDDEIAEIFNRKKMLSSTNRPFTKKMISWIRHKHSIPAPKLKHPDECSVKQLCDKFGISKNVVYYWIERGIINARKINNGSPYWITLNPEKEIELNTWVKTSKRIKTTTNSSTNS